MNTITDDTKTEAILSKEEVILGLKKLLEQLEDYETESKQTLDNLSSSLKHYKIRNIKKLSDLINDYEFEEAFELCEEIVKKV